MHIIITGTAHIACGVASMKWYSVHPSVYLSTALGSKKTHCILLLWAWQAENINRLLQPRHVAGKFNNRRM